MKNSPLFSLFSLFLTAIVSVSMAANAQSKCDRLLSENNPPVSSVQYLVENNLDFAMTSFSGKLSPLRSYGCAVVSALNVWQGFRVESGLSPLSTEDLNEVVFPLIEDQMIPKGFGTHAASATKGLNIGSLAKLMESIMSRSNPQIRSESRAFYVEVGRNTLAHEGNIEFLKNIGGQAFTVNDSLSKIVLVSVNDIRWLGTSNSYLTAHYYTVLSYDGDIVTLHDPNIKGSQIQFKAVSDTDTATGVTTFVLKPMTPGYTIDESFPKDLLYVVSGYISVELK